MLINVCSSLSSPCLMGDSPGLLMTALGSSVLPVIDLLLQQVSLEVWGLKMFSPSVVSVSLESLDTTCGCRGAVDLRMLETWAEKRFLGYYDDKSYQADSRSGAQISGWSSFLCVCLTAELRSSHLCWETDSSGSSR